MKKIYISPEIEIFVDVCEPMLSGASAHDVVTKANNARNGGAIFDETQTPGINYYANPNSEEYLEIDEFGLDDGDL